MLLNYFSNIQRKNQFVKTLGKKFYFFPSFVVVTFIISLNMLQIYNPQSRLSIPQFK